MNVLIRFAVSITIIGACQATWAQAYAEFPIEGAIVEGPAFVEGVALPGEYPVQGAIVEGGIINEGVVYAGNEFPITSNVGQVSYEAPVSSGVNYGGGGGDLLSVVNQKRRRSGLSALMFDGELSRIAQNKSNIRANRRITGHEGSGRGRARVEGVGYAYGGNLTQRFNTCYLYANGYSHAGAAIAYDNSGRAYYTLLLR